MSDVERKQIEGVCEEISEKNGWVSFAVDIGRNYPVRLSTKLPALVDEGRAAGNQRAIWTFSESQGGENPNKPGTYYINRRLEKVEVGGQAVAPSAPSGGASQGVSGPRDSSTNRSIERQTIVKALVPIYPIDAIGEDAWWWNLLGKLDDFMVKGVPRPQQAQEPPAASGGGSYEREDFIPASPPEEDDIPF